MDPNLAQVQQQPPLQPTQFEKHSAKVFWAYFIAITLAIVLGISGYFIGFEQASSKQSSIAPKITLQSAPKLPPGIQKTLDSFKRNPKLLLWTNISQTYMGKLTSFVPEKSWTLENDRETITINNENNNKVEYFTIVLVEKGQGPNNNEIQPNDNVIIKIGDTVGITRSFTADGKNSTIDRIVLGLPPQGATSAASPSPSTTQK